MPQEPSSVEGLDSGEDKRLSQGTQAGNPGWVSRWKDTVNVVYFFFGMFAVIFAVYMHTKGTGGKPEPPAGKKKDERKDAPEIAIEVHRITNPKTRIPESDELRVVNYGPPIRDFHWEAYTFVQGHLPEDEVAVREIHFMGYWLKQDRTGKRQGEVVRFQGGTNYRELCQLTDQLRSFVRKPSMRPLAVVTFIALRYRNRDNNPLDDYFACLSGDECVTIGCARWQQACFAARSAMERGESLIRGKITAAKALERLRQASPDKIHPSPSCPGCEQTKAHLTQP